MERLIKSFIDFYGEEHIDYDKIDDYTLYIFIYFPEITITNTYGDTYKKKELYVRCKFTGNKKVRLENIYIGSTHFTDAESITRYVHSHVNINALNSFGKVCLGNSGPVYKIVNTMSEYMPMEKLLSYIPTFVPLLQAFLETESSDSSPYQMFTALSTLKTMLCPLQVRDLEMSVAIEKEFIEAANNALRDKAVKVVYQEGILLLDMSEIELAVLANKYVKGGATALYIIKDARLHFVKGTNASSSEERFPLLKFKGEDKYITIKRGKNITQTYEFYESNIIRRFILHLIYQANVLYEKYQHKYITGQD